VSNLAFDSLLLDQWLPDGRRHVEERRIPRRDQGHVHLGWHRQEGGTGNPQVVLRRRVRRRQQGRTIRLAVLEFALFCVRGGGLLTTRFASFAFQVSDETYLFLFRKCIYFNIK
jgi:hypothetical protein